MGHGCIHLTYTRPSMDSPRRGIEGGIDFAVLSGPCTSAGSCVTSPHYPDFYGNYESCAILAPEKPLYFTRFDTEAGYDFLTFGGQAYSGSSGPPNGTTTPVIVWRSDASHTASGWSACTADGLNYSGVSNKYSDVFVVHISFHFPLPHKVP